MTLEVIILAAGQGTRMRSRLPKVLHGIAGRPMLGHVIDTAAELGAARTHVVIGHGAEAVRDHFGDAPVSWALQSEQLGTGHAVAQALPAVADDATVLVLYGDVPLVQAATLRELLDVTAGGRMGLLTVTLPDPTGYGRIVREQGAVRAIVEQKDASAEQLAIDEVNTGILAVSAACLRRWLPALSADNAQGEYYLTDTIAMAVAEGIAVNAVRPARRFEVEGVNNRAQLAALERIHQLDIATRLMADGATLADPGRIDVRGSLEVGRDVFIDVGCVFEGEVSLADEVKVGPACVIRNADIGPGARVEAHSIIDGAAIAAGASVGPFARLRPGTALAEGSKVGNFVEIKKAVVGPGSKVNHLSYIGDTEIGRGANVGAGTITCNYDGANKYRSEIGDGAFIGSNSALVAPVRIGSDATIAAGSVITGDVESGQLAVARSRQRNIDGWQRPSKKKDD